MKRIIVLILLTAVMLSAFSFPSHAENNATSGDGEAGRAQVHDSFYRGKECMWKVSIWVGKTDNANTQSKLLSDYYKIGMFYLYKNWNVTSPIKFGNASKAEYLNGTTFINVSLDQITIVKDDLMPYPPVLYKENGVNVSSIQEVKNYFGSVGFLQNSLKYIADKQNCNTYALVKDKKFTIGGITKSGWSSEYIIPNVNEKQTMHRVPWVVVYEPVVVLHLNDGKDTKLAFTATEYILAESMYNWDRSGIAVTYNLLPSSVQLEESWFGYDIFPTKTGSWSKLQVLAGGGWGMRFLNISQNLDFSHDLSIKCVTPNSDYKAGVTVVTSYMIYNNSITLDVLPQNKNTIKFEVYYYKNGTKYSISNQTWKYFVVPANDKNLVWFKWTIPKDITGLAVYCRATVNADNTIVEESRENNIALMTREIKPLSDSQTPDTKYERTKPSTFSLSAPPASSQIGASWTVWEYSNNKFIHKTYGICISKYGAKILPDEDVKTVSYINNDYYMKSGYGFTLNYSAETTTITGCNTPPKSAYTNIQLVRATFPEFAYSIENDKYRVLEEVGGIWQFIKNENADENERLHFTPLWFPDGKYVVNVIASEVWTPSGMIQTSSRSNAILISGSAYADWHISHR